MAEDVAFLPSGRVDLDHHEWSGPGEPDAAEDPDDLA
jgi:hypothetical protein